MWDTVLFDLDGTLTDSGEGITKSAQYALEKEFGMKIEDPHELDFFVGPPLKDSFMEYAGLTEEEASRAIKAYRERYTVTGIYENRLYDGIGSLLSALSAEGFQIALASSKPTEFCVQILRYFGIAQYFTAIVGSELNGSRVRKSEVIEEALARVGKSNSRSDVVLVGDRKYDVEGARTAGISSIGVTYGYGSREELEKIWPDCIVDNTEELKNVLIGQMRDEKSHRILSDARYGDGRAERRPAGSAESASIWWKLWRIAYPILTDLAISNVVSFVLGLGIGMAASFWYMYHHVNFTQADITSVITRSYMPIYIIATLVSLPIIMIFFMNDEEKRRVNGQTDRILQKRGMNPASVILILMLTLFVSNPLNAIAEQFPVKNPVYQTFLQSMETSIPFFVTIAVGILGPFIEELIFRGLVYRRARDYFGFVPAVLISAALFALIHGNMQQGVFAFFAGIFLALLYEHYGTIAAPVIFHVFNNLYAQFSGDILSSMVPKWAEVIIMILSILLTAFFSWVIFVRDRKVNRI